MRRPAARVRKVVAAVLLAAAVIYFAADFAYFNSPHPPATGKDAPLRVPGVLQRIALCYFFASIIVLTCGVYRRAMWAALLLAGYWWIVTKVSPPAGYVPSFTGRPEGWLHDWLDLRLLGRHLYGERPDPEGILSTLPAIATTLIGVLVGNWLYTRRERGTHWRDASATALGLFFFGNLLIVVGLWMNHAFPINKKIWTSSYVLFTAGAAMEFLAMCYWLIDVKGWRRWAWPFMVFGTNAILVFFASGIVGRLLSFTRIHPADGQEISVRNWIYQTFFAAYAQPVNASLAFAMAYVLFWFVLLVPLHLKRIYLKI